MGSERRQIRLDSKSRLRLFISPSNIPPYKKRALRGSFLCENILFRSFSVYQKESDHLDQESHCPGNAVGIIQALGRMESGDLKDSADPADTDAAYPQNGDDHGGNRSTHTPKGTGGNIHQTADEIRDTQAGQTDHAPLQGFRRIGNIDGQQGRPHQISKGGNACADHEYTGQAEAQDAGDSLILLCPCVLADEVQGSLVEGVYGNVNEAFDIG